MKKIVLWVVAILSAGYSFSQEPLVKANNNFTFRIYRATRPDTGNFFISPFSLSTAMSIVNEGSATTTRVEMDDLLSTGPVNNQSSAYMELLHKTLQTNERSTCFLDSENNNSKNELLLANSLWIRDDTPIKENYKRVVETDYRSDVFSFSKNDLSGAGQQLDNWIAKKTSGKINGMELSADARMSIINAIYFMGEWQDPFQKTKTKERNFHSLSKEKVKMDFLNKESRLDYYENEDMQCVGIPYNCNEFSMVILLPKKRFGIITLEEKLTAEYFSTINLYPASEVILSMPKFRIESEVRPISNIEAMGYSEMFSDHADFSGMSDTTLKIGSIIHKTFIEVNEARTEAAAVTEVEMVVTGGGGGQPAEPPQPKIFNANHSFVFLIVDNRSKAILFIGRVTGK